MRTEIKNCSLSCAERRSQSFLSCALRTESAKTSNWKTNRKCSGPKSLWCVSGNSPESDTKNSEVYRAPSTITSKKTLILGIDPGLTGGIAVIKSGKIPEFVAVFDMPNKETKGKNRVDLDVLSFLIESYSKDLILALVEEVGFMKGQEGRASAFVFGFATGAVHGVLAAFSIPIQTIKPLVWKPALGLGSDKDKAIQKAIKLFPQAASFLQRKKDHGRAEALLLAYFANKLAA